MNNFTNHNTRYRLLLKEELRLKIEQGGDVDSIRQEIDDYQDEMTRERCIYFFNKLAELETKYSEDDEPSEYHQILKCRPKGPRMVKKCFSRQTLHNKLLGGWYGRTIGCLLGKPVEGWDKEDIKLLGTLTTGYPLSYYLGSVFPPPAEQINKRFSKLLVTRFATKGYEGVHDYLDDGMPSDDDMNYTILNTNLLEKLGPCFTTEDVADEWQNSIPYNGVCCGEKIVYKNLVNNVPPPESACFLNPAREHIGAQIRADAYGYICPGMPEKAAAMAFKDASLSHVRNGIYGSMWVAGMIAMAYVSDDIFEIIEAGLSEIPDNSRLSEAIRKVVSFWEKNKNWEETLAFMETHYGKHLMHEGHTVNNACVVAIALLEGREDFEKGLSVSVMCGYDTDCNGATAASILGILHGVDKIADKWKAPLKDTIKTAIVGFNKVNIPEMVLKSLDLALNMLMSETSIENIAENSLKEEKVSDYFYELCRL